MTVIVIVYVYYTLTIRDKPALMNNIECIKKEYLTWSIGELESLVGCAIKRDLTNMTLNLSQPDLITKMTQRFNKDVK